MQAQQLGRIYLGHLIDLLRGETLRFQIRQKSLESIGRQRVAGLSQIARENAPFRTHLPDRLCIFANLEHLVGSDQRVVDELNKRAKLRGLLHLRDRHSHRRKHGVRHHHMLNTLPAPFAQQQQAFLG